MPLFGVTEIATEAGNLRPVERAGSMALNAAVRGSNAIGDR